MSWNVVLVAAQSDASAGARPAWLYFWPSHVSVPFTGWQLLQVAALKFASAVIVSIFAWLRWQVTQFAIDMGYGNSMACVWCVSCITLALYAYLVASAVPPVAQAYGSSAMYCQSRWPPVRSS